MGYANTVSVGRGIPIWMTGSANQATRKNDKGMTGPQLAREFRKAIASGNHPFEPFMTTSNEMGGSPLNKNKFNNTANNTFQS